MILKLLNRINKKLKLSRIFNFTLRRFDGDVHYKYPVLGGEGFANIYVTEKWILDILDGLKISGNACFIDVGANIGQTLVKIKSHFKDIRYIAFEPNPVCVNYLQKLIALNKYENIDLIPVGIFEKNCLLELVAHGVMDSGASVIKEFRPGQNFSSKQIVALMNYDSISELIVFDDDSILKIDTEGSELEVVSGLIPLLKQKNPLIFIEILPVYKNENAFRKVREEKLLNIFEELNYLLFRVIKNASGKLDRLQRLYTIEIHSNLNECDYLIIRKSNRYFDQLMKLT